MKKSTILFLGLAASLMIAGCSGTTGDSSASASSDTPASSDSPASSTGEASSETPESSSETPASSAEESSSAPSSEPSSSQPASSEPSSSQPSSSEPSSSQPSSSEPSSSQSSGESSAESSGQSSHESSGGSSSQEPAGADVIITGMEGTTQTSWTSPYAYTYTATLGLTSIIYGTTDSPSELNLNSMQISLSEEGIISYELSQSIDDWKCYRVEFAIEALKEGTTVLTIVDGGNYTHQVTITVSESSRSAWDDVLIGWNATNLAKYATALAPVEPTFPYTSATFISDESGWSYGSYTLSITAAADYWETYINALTAADAANQNYTWNFGAYDATTDSYPLTVIGYLSGSSTYDSTIGAIVISFAAAE